MIIHLVERLDVFQFECTRWKDEEARRINVQRLVVFQPAHLQLGGGRDLDVAVEAGRVANADDDVARLLVETRQGGQLKFGLPTDHGAHADQRRHALVDAFVGTLVARVLHVGKVERSVGQNGSVELSKLIKKFMKLTKYIGKQKLNRLI